MNWFMFTYYMFASLFANAHAEIKTDLYARAHTKNTSITTTNGQAHKRTSTWQKANETDRQKRIHSFICWAIKREQNLGRSKSFVEN